MANEVPEHTCNKKGSKNCTGEAWDDEAKGLSFWETWTEYWCDICGTHQGEGNKQQHSTKIGQI